VETPRFLSVPAHLQVRHHLLGQSGDVVAADDFLTVETVFLKTLYVLVFMDIQTRRILGIGVSANPNGTRGDPAGAQPDDGSGRRPRALRALPAPRPRR